ncbi:MAG: hypothetical protein FJY86_01735 [Candidatus Diapherotrites archaeon]|uniref:Uncharacterized protein n=1 Tax=Candidatus Iainarchaeum sp. TaxID=3101447 RepID=A0A8T4CA83_9ARCH|nr:hypothetical protein [Candidatus Diapherotrites archaeon]
MLLSLFAGFIIGWLSYRAGFPILFPLLLWLPYLVPFSDSYWVIGLAAASIIGLIYSIPSALPEDVFLSFFVSSFMVVVAFFLFQFVSLDIFVFPILVVLLLFWFFRLPSPRRNSLIGFFIIFLAGWWLLHVHSISTALSSFFSGWWLMSFTSPIDKNDYSLLHKIRDAVGGSFLGFLPGLGPGIANGLFFSSRSSHVLGISNLIFSLGYFFTHDKVRSIFASVFVSFSPLPIFTVFWSLLLILVFGFLFWNIFPRISLPIPSIFFYFFIFVSFLLLGGWLSAGVWIFALSLRIVFDYFSLPCELGSFILLPSILWFYFPLF